jgi:hypothetical protein
VAGVLQLIIFYFNQATVFVANLCGTCSKQLLLPLSINGAHGHGEKNPPLPWLLVLPVHLIYCTDKHSTAISKEKEVQARRTLSKKLLRA